MRRALLAIGASLCVAGLLATLAQVAELAADERDYRGPLATVGELTGTHASLGQLRLARGQRVSFSVCSTDAFVSGAWKAASFAIFHHQPTELVLRVTLDEARLASLREGPGGGCVDLARADALSGEGQFSVVVEGAVREGTAGEGTAGEGTAGEGAAGEGAAGEGAAGEGAAGDGPEGRAPVRELAPPDTQLWTHVTALRPLTAAHMGGPLAAWLGVLLLTLAWLLRPPAPSAFDRLAAEDLGAGPVTEDLGAGPVTGDLGAGPVTAPDASSDADLDPKSDAARDAGQDPDASPPSGPRATPGRVLAFALVGLLLAFACSAALPPSSLTPMSAALLLFAGQLILAFTLTRGPQPLALVAPVRWPWLLLAMPLLGVALRLGLAPLSQLVPATGVAPIEQLVSAPSGLLTMLAIGLVAPFAEELFFRGLLFAQLEALRGPRWAAAITALLFALLHAPQAFGAWPSLISIACAGTAFSVLRWRTGSTLASVLAHLGYNGIIALPFVVSVLTR